MNTEGKQLIIIRLLAIETTVQFTANYQMEAKKGKINNLGLINGDQGDFC